MWCVVPWVLRLCRSRLSRPEFSISLRQLGLIRATEPWRGRGKWGNHDRSVVVLGCRVGGFKVLEFRGFDFRGVGRKVLGAWSLGHRREGPLEVRHLKLKAQGCFRGLGFRK